MRTRASGVLGESDDFYALFFTEFQAEFLELELLDFAAAGEGEAIDEEDVFRNLVAGDLAAAQLKLDAVIDRNAEWHYLQAVVFYRKGWANESKKQLEIARQMRPNTEKYDKAYERLTGKMSQGVNGGNNGAYNGQFGAAANGGNGAGNYDEPQMGGEGCFDFCCRLAICNLLLNCCCNCR